LDLLFPLGAALTAAQSYGSDEVRTVYHRALALGEACGTPHDLMRARRGVWNVAILHCDLVGAHAVAERLLAEAESAGDERMRADAHAKMGQALLHEGRLRAARSHLESALGPPSAATDAAASREAPRIAASLSWALWYGGEPARATCTSDRALELAR